MFTDKKKSLSWKQRLAFFALGAVSSLAFLPSDLLGWIASLLTALLAVVVFAVLISFWAKCETPKCGFQTGWFFGAGLFLAGLYWLFIAMSGFGNMPAPVALVLLVLLIAFLALFPALAGWLAVKCFNGAGRLIALPALFTAFELLRGTIFGGLPWLVAGTSQALPSPLAGATVWGGIYFTSLVILGIGALVAAYTRYVEVEHPFSKTGIALLGGIVLLLAFSATALFIPFTHPVGKPLPVTLVQGDIPQDVKFDPKFHDATYLRYDTMASGAKGKLILLPESSFPDFMETIPQDQIDLFQGIAKKKNAAIIAGAFTATANPGGLHDHYYNSIFTLGVSPEQIYRKRHLVLFGEKIPFESIVAPVMDALIHMPIAGQSEGAEDQPPFDVLGQRIAISICFEDAFGGEQIERERASTMLANFTNDGWFGHSLEAWQHHRIASMRSLESGRPMARVTNTGITAVIDYRGATRKRLKWFTMDNLESEITGREGETPYLIWGDKAVEGIIVLMLILGFALSRKETFKG